MKNTRFVLTVVILGLAVSQVAGAPLVEFGGTGGRVVGPGDGDDITGSLANSWNAPPYDCSQQLRGPIRSTLTITKTGGSSCVNQAYNAAFAVVGPMPGGFGLTLQMACNNESGKLTSFFGACSEIGGDPCTCVGAPFPLNCLPSAAEGSLNSCEGTCTDVTGCGNIIANRCDGDAGRFCIVDADCRFCANQPDLGCNADADCDLGGCGALIGSCSLNPALDCLPAYAGGSDVCTGACTPAGCGSIIPGQCDDNPNVACAGAAQCGSCSNAPTQPCATNGDCDFGTCDENLINIDAGGTFFNIEVSASFPTSPAPTGLSTVDPLKAGLLIAGLLAIGVVLILRYGR